MTDVLIARLTHGRLNFAVLHEVEGDWATRAQVFGPFVFAELRPGDADRINLPRFTRFAETRAASSLTDLVDQWLVEREFTQPLPPLSLASAYDLADDTDNPDWLIEAMRHAARRGLGLRLVGDRHA